MISEKITKLAAVPKSVNMNDLVRELLDARLGFAMVGLPELGPKEQDYVVKGTGVSIQYATDPNGRNMIKACADPEIFVKNYPNTKINALMTGRQSLEMLMKMDDAYGLLVCSALSFHSWPIYKDEAIRMTKIKSDIPPKKWWKIW